MNDQELIERSERAKSWLEEKGSRSKLISASEREMIAMAEDRGWKDSIPTESEAVVWLMKMKGMIISFYKGEWFQTDWNKFHPVEEATRLGYAEDQT